MQQIALVSAVIPSSAPPTPAVAGIPTPPTAMAPKPKTFRPLVHDRCLTVSGGFVPSKKFVPQSRVFEVEGGDKKQMECVLLGHTEPWLCEIATGQTKHMRPLARVRILRELRVLLSDPRPEVDPKMQALAFDDSESSEMETPRKKPQRTSKREEKSQKRKPQTTSAVAEISKRGMCRLVKVWESASSRSKKISIYAALDERQRVWLHVDALNWLIGYVKDEKGSGGVEPIEDAGDEADPPRIFWNFRDDSWNARAQTPDGAWMQLNRGIRRFQRRDGLGAQSSKQSVYSIMENWVAAVERGEVAKQGETGIA